MNNNTKMCENNDRLWKNCMLTWGGSPIENNCLKFKLRLDKCKEVFISKNNNGKKIIMINNIKKIK